MPGPNQGNDSFASVLSRAQQLPEVADGQGKDLPDGFPLPVATHHKVVDTAKDPTAIEGMVAYDFTCHRAIYLIYRPWDVCKRCTEALGNGHVALPTDGDYTCPHTDLAKYQVTVNRTLSGEALYGSENEVVQKDGSIVISVKWYEKKLNPNRKKSKIAPTQPGQRDEPDR